ncbi:FAD-dependent oxidoreductase [Arhodomonas sp. SL1]|uniref:FAD-dependent oxidoreductase n=1 Tax=Arhodomonas sp. SL1 TaxID=3425691 RepID=UPI003F884F07
MTATGHIAIVGAGPAGESAALTLTDAGRPVTVFDEQPRPGGNINRIAADAPPGPLERAGPGLRLACATTVLAVDADGTVTHHSEDGLGAERFAAVILACGAYDLHRPLPGTPAPAVSSAGALQALLKGQGVVPSGETVIAGAGPFLYVAAAGLARAGARVSAVVDALGVTDYARLVPAGAGIPGNAVELAGHLATVKRHGTTVMRGRRAEAVEADRLVLEGGDAIPFDRLGLTDGFIAQSQLPRTAGCRLRWHAPGGYFVAGTDDHGRSSVPGVLVCGEGQGVRGWRHARISGKLAALAVLADAGEAVDEGRRRRLLAARRRHIRFGEALERALSSAAPMPADDAIICACESVPAGPVREAVATGLTDVSSVKVVTRCGMGPCQGRYCEPHVARTIERGGHEPTGALNQRMLTRPVTAGELARGA